MHSQGDVKFNQSPAIHPPVWHLGDPMGLEIEVSTNFQEKNDALSTHPLYNIFDHT